MYKHTMTWAELKKIADSLSPEQLKETVLRQNGDTGEYVEVGISSKEEHDPDFFPSSAVFVLD